MDNYVKMKCTIFSSTYHFF